jgi:5'-AMP-activated protein kinase catalytic alpha subunit
MDIEFAQRCLEANRHNHSTTSYYLMLKKHLRDGGASKADLGSKNFDKSLI